MHLGFAPTPKSLVAALALAALLAAAAATAQAQAVPWPGPTPPNDYASARQVTLTSGSKAIPAGSVVSLTFDHAAMVPTYAQAGGDDVRLAYRSGGVVTEIPRTLANGSNWNNAATKLMFKTQALIPATSSDANYFLFYGNPAATAPAAGGVPSARIFKAEQLTEQSTLSAALVDVPGTTLTFTPGETTETWVIFASGVFRSEANNNVAAQISLVIDGAEVDTWGQKNKNPNPPNGSGFLMFNRITGTTAAHTVKLQFQTLSAGNHTYATSLRVIAVLLPQGSDFQFSEDPASLHLPKNSVSAALQTLTFTPSSAGDYFIFGTGTHSDPGGGVVQSWVEDDAGGDHPDTTPGNVHYSNPIITQSGFTSAFRRTLPATPRTFTLRGTTGGNNGSIWTDRRLMAFRADAWETAESSESPALLTSTGTAFVLKNSLLTAAPPAPREYLVVQVERISGPSDQNLQKSGVFRDGGTTLLRTDHHIDADGSAGGLHHVAGLANVKTTASSVLYENGFQSSNGSAVECADSTIMAMRFLEPTVSQRPLVRSVTSTKADGTWGIGTVIDIQVRFSEAVLVTGTPQLTLATGGGGVAVPLFSVSGDTLTFQYTVAPGQTSADLDVPGTGAFALAGAILRDLAGIDDDILLPAPGTLGSLGANKNLVIDGIVPGPAGTPAGTPNPNNSGTFTVNWGAASDTGGTGVGTVTYRVERSFNGGTFTLLNPSVAGTSLVETALADGLYRYHVQAFDLAGNPGPVSGDSAPVVVDKTSPFISSITANDTDPTDLATVGYTVTFSELVLGVEETDFTLITSGVTGAAITSVTGSGTTWTVNVSTGSGFGSIQLAVAAIPTITEGSGAGNPLIGPYPSAPIYHKVGPAVVSISRLNFVQTSNPTVDYLVTFNKNVTGVDASDFVVVMTGAVTGAGVSGITGSGNSYTVTVNTGIGDGGLQLNLIDDDSIIDTPGNPLGGVGAGNGNATGLPYVIDKSFPSVSSIVRAGTSPTNAASVNFTVTFSETVVALASTDFSVVMGSGLTGATITSITPGPSITWTVTVNTGSGSGTIGLNIVDTDTILDVTGNPLGGIGAANGNFTGQVYTIDKTPPTVLSIVRAGADPTNAASVNFTVTFSEAVTGVDALDFALVTTGVSVPGIGLVSGSGTTWTVAVSTGTGNGTIQLNLAGSPVIQDLLGIALTAPFTSGEKYTIDKTAPSIAISAPSAPTTTAGPVSYTVTYTGATTVTLVPGDVVLIPTGTATGAVGVSGSGSASRTVTITGITGSGTLAISINAGTASDSATNLALGAGPSASFSVTNTGTIGLPTLLQVETLTNPMQVGRAPAFSAQHNWSGATPSDAVSFQIQVSTDSTFAALTHWNSPSGTLFPGSVSVPAGTRSPEIRYGTGGGSLQSLSWNQQYFWRVEFKDALSDLSGFSSEVASFRMTSPSAVTSANGNGTQSATGWRYVGFPIAVGDSISASALLNTISYAYKWDEPTRQWIQLTGADMLEGGRGYIAWADPGTPLTLTTGKVALGDQPIHLSFIHLGSPTGAEITENKPFDYYRGAHFIANPFNAPIYWGDPGNVTGDVAKTDLSTNYDKWDGTQYLTYNSASGAGTAGSTIAPFQAIGVKVMTGAAGPSLIIHEPPASSFVSSKALMAAVGGPSANAWSLHLVATSGAALDTENYLGIHPSAQDTWDIRDSDEPGHAATTWVLLYFDHTDWPTHPHLYTHDFRKTRLNAGDEIVWTGTVESNSGSAVTLTWPNFATMPTSDWQYFIEDPVAGTSIDMATAASMDIGPLTGPATVVIRAVRLTSAAGTLGVSATAGGPAPTSVAPGASNVSIVSLDVVASGEAVTVQNWVVHHEGTGDPSKVQVSLYNGPTRIAGPSPFDGTAAVLWSGLGQTVGAGSPQTWTLVYDFAADATGTYRAAVYAGEIEGVGNSSGFTINPSPTLIESSEVTVTSGAGAPVPPGGSTAGAGGGRSRGRCGLLGVEFLGIAALLALRRRFGGRRRATE